MHTAALLRPHSASSFRRLWHLLALLALAAGLSGCPKKSGTVIDNTDEFTDEECTDETCGDAIEGVDAADAGQDVKQDVKVKPDTGPVDSGSTDSAEVGEPEDVVEGDDLEDAETDVEDPDLEEADAESDTELDTEPDTEPDSDAAIDAEDVAVDIGPVTGAACVKDGDCAAQPDPGPCMLGYKCLTVEGKAQCVAVPEPEGQMCDDADACTTGDHCVLIPASPSGEPVDTAQCVGVTKFCTDKKQCTKDTCDPFKGCQFEAAILDGTACNDGNNCTEGETCFGGDCDNSASIKKCQCMADAECQDFEDGDLCNGTLTCQAGYCAVDVLTVVIDSATGLQCSPKLDNDCQTNTCDPKLGKCAQKFAVVGTACSDGDACTGGGKCLDGKCAGSALNCDDDNACTNDSCTSNLGCVHTNNANACDDGDGCTGPDSCKSGSCGGAPALNPDGTAVCTCKDDAGCKSLDLADPKCTGTHVCSLGQCQLKSGSVVKCPIAQGDCFEAKCAPASGACVTTLKKDPNDPSKQDTTCSDGDVCTLGEKCNAAGVCGGDGTKLQCDDGNPCTTDSCNKLLGCTHVANALPCDDGNPCTKAAAPGDLETDHCASGACVPGTASECQCSSDADCDKLKIVNKCLTKATCADSGQGTSHCLFANDAVVTCPAAGKCDSWLCNPGNGVCQQTKLTGPVCNDDALCTLGDHCDKGNCAGTMNECNDGNLCTEDGCTTATGLCANPPLTTAAACSDGSSCTNSDACLAGKCIGKAVSCDDSNSCTTDACDKVLGCTHKPVALGTACSDGNPCTGEPSGSADKKDHCDVAGKCSPGVAKACSDELLCTDDACDPTSTTLSGDQLGCVHMYNTVTCEDGNPCSVNDNCALGLCKAGTAKNCEDGNSCTLDSCVSKNPPAGYAIGCNNKSTADPCDDGNLCTATDACSAGTCIGKLLDCDDQNACTLDSCDPLSKAKKPDGTPDGCVYAKNTGSGPCGGFAECSSDIVPSCVFPPGQHLMISEVFMGVPGDPTDDWVELHNPTDKLADLNDYVLQARPFAASDVAEWQTLAKLGKGVAIAAHGYLLIGNKATAHGGVTVDVVAPTLQLASDASAKANDEWQLRLYDPLHQLPHDFLCWSHAVGQCNQGSVPLPSLVTGVVLEATAGAGLGFNTANSLERKANAKSTRETMFLHGPDWLAGNDRDTDDNSADFVLRWAPEPQNALKQYEPACGGSCGAGQTCNFDPVAKCVGDSLCAIGCGSGKSCSSGIGGCVALVGSLFSEVYPGGAAGEYLELHNATVKVGDVTDISGFVVQTKTAQALPGDPWTPIYQFPAGSGLPASRYLVLSNKLWAQGNGGVDVVRTAAMNLAPSGSAVRLWDPRTDTGMDQVGWGDALVFSGKPAPALVDLSSALERKAKPGSDAVAMEDGGADRYAGNDVDTDTDGEDWLVATARDPQSLASGQYEPACAGTCKSGLVCNFKPGAEKCLDPGCGGTCNTGAACNAKTGACDLYVVIAEFATEGPPGTNNLGQAMTKAENEYLVLYNPSATAVSLAGLALQYFDYNVSGTWKALSDYGCDQNPAPSPPVVPDANTGWCPKPKIGSAKRVLAGYIEAQSYYLITANRYDSKLPVPDFTTSLVLKQTWDIDAANGGLRLVRINGTYPNTNLTVADRAVWGKAVAASVGEGGCTTPAQEPSPPGVGAPGAIRRKALASSTATTLINTTSADYYAGAGVDANSNCNDFVAIAVASPAAQMCIRAPRDQVQCGTSVVHQKP